MLRKDLDYIRKISKDAENLETEVCTNERIIFMTVNERTRVYKLCS